MFVDIAVSMLQPWYLFQVGAGTIVHESGGSLPMAHHGCSLWLGGNSQLPIRHVCMDVPVHTKFWYTSYTFLGGESRDPVADRAFSVPSAGACYTVCQISEA